MIVTAQAAAVSEIIVESFEDGLNHQWFSTEGGKWTPSTSKSKAEGLQATKTRFDDANDVIGSATFKPEIPAEGKYEVFFTYPQSGNAIGAIYKVHSADGDKEQKFDQNGRDQTAKPPADQWVSLGVFQFKKGAEGFVQISDPGTGEKANQNEPNARIYADAVKFVPQGFEMPANFANKSGISGTGSTASASATSGNAASGATGSSASAGVPSLPLSGSTSSTGGTSLPVLPPPASSTSAGASALPALPAGGSAPSGSSLPSLPGSGLSAASASTSLPSLPSSGSSANASSPLPSLPGSSSPEPAASGAASSGLPALPSSTSASTAPSLPETGNMPPLPASDMPSLPSTVPGSPVASVPPPAISGEASTPPSATPPQPDESGLPWIYDIGQARNMSRETGKNVLVFFVAKGNRQVARYESEIFRNPQVRELLDKFILVKIDFVQNTKTAYAQGIYWAGTVVVLNSKGDRVASVPQAPPTAELFMQQVQGAKPEGSAGTTPEKTAAAGPAKK